MVNQDTLSGPTGPAPTYSFSKLARHLVAYSGRAICRLLRLGYRGPNNDLPAPPTAYIIHAGAHGNGDFIFRYQTFLHAEL